MNTEVILVDENDRPTGSMEKLEAHQKGLLHRAFSVFIINSEGQMLLQKRASGKYHSGGLWTNACCSHPSPGENTAASAERRLQEEMGFSCPLVELDQFKYCAHFENGLTEHEYDHIFLGTYNGAVSVNKEEVEDYQWHSVQEIERLLDTEKEKFTYWFHIAFPIVKEKLEKGFDFHKE